MIFVPPSFLSGRRLRPCFDGVDAPELLFTFNSDLKTTLYLPVVNSVSSLQIYSKYAFEIDKVVTMVFKSDNRRRSYTTVISTLVSHSLRHRQI